MPRSPRRLAVAAAGLSLLAATSTTSLAATAAGSAADSPAGVSTGTGSGAGDGLARAFSRLDRDTQWELVDRVPLPYRTYHPQGFALVGNRIFLSTVEVIKQPVCTRSRATGTTAPPARGSVTCWC